jgi:hypothetical protein
VSDTNAVGLVALVFGAIAVLALYALSLNIRIDRLQVDVDRTRVTVCTMLRADPPATQRRQGCRP